MGPVADWPYVMQQEAVNSTLRGVYLALAVFNIVAVLMFAVLLFVVPMFSQLETRVRFTELDRAGVVNPPALKQFHPSYGFGDITTLEYRRTVPDYVAASPLAAQRENALLGFLITLANALVWLVLWRKSRPAPSPRPAA